MMRRTYALAATSLLGLSLSTLAPHPALAQEFEVGPESAAIAAGGQGEVTLRPDRATVSVSVRTVAPDPEQASTRNLEIAGEVAEALRALDLRPDSLRTTSVQVGPNIEYTPDGPREAGYFAERSLRVTTDDLGAVGRIIQAAVGAGATQVDRIAYSSSEEAAARRQALRRAVERARGDAEAVADAAGGRLGAVILMTTDDVSVPRPMYRMESAEMGMGGDQPLPEPEDITVTARVQGHWELVGVD